MIRVFIVNEIRLVCHVIAAVLQEEPDIEIVGLATSLEEALPRAVFSDVVLVSSSLPNQDALELTRQMAERRMPVKVVVLGLTESEDEILRYVEMGASGYVLKDDPVEGLLRKIRATHNGEALVSPEIAAALISRIAELAQLFPDTLREHESDGLTARELEVLKLIGEGLSNQEIADRLVIEMGTVKNHVHSILQKLNVSSRRDAAAYLTAIDS